MADGVKITFVRVPAGKFVMGTNDGGCSVGKDGGDGYRSAADGKGESLVPVLQLSAES